MTAECSSLEESRPSPTMLVKDELARRPLSMRCCLFTETAVTLRLAGTVALERRGMRLAVVLDHPGAARRLEVVVATLIGQQPTVEVTQGRRPADTRWVVRVEIGAAALARKVGLCDGTGRPVRGIPQHVMVSAGCCQAAAWRAAMLASGTLSAGTGERRLRVACPDLPSAVSLAMLAERIAGRARVPALGPPQVIVEMAGGLGRVLCAIGVSETTIAALLRTPSRSQTSAGRWNRSRLDARLTSD